METSKYAEQLTPLDLIMPRCYTRILLTFSTKHPVSALLRVLQNGLDATCAMWPWLAGRVTPKSTATGKPTLEIRWDSEPSPPKVLDLGTIQVAYEDAIKAGMPLITVPDNVWPAPGLIDDKLHNAGAAVMVAGLVRFQDGKGVGLCICLHHNAVDAGGVAEMIKSWALQVESASSTTEASNTLENVKPHGAESRLTRLTSALLTDLQALETRALEDLLSQHPEYSLSFTTPDQFPPCTSRVITFDVSRLEQLKAKVQAESATPDTTFSTNTVLCAVLWTVFTRVRYRRDPSLYSNGGAARLGMAVNGRTRISPSFSAAENPYLGNVNLYSLAQLSASALNSASHDAPKALVQVCAEIASSNAASRITSRHIAECVSIVERLDDYKLLFPGWTLYNGPDLTVTSWMNLGMPEAEFGRFLGNPTFLRVPFARADSICVVLPRRRGFVPEVLEVVVAMRSDDLDAMEKDGLWRSVVLQ